MKSGIYKIVNTINGKCYVGSTIDFEKRWKRHFNDLKNQRHSSITFQRAYNKYGKDAFICEIIEEIPYEKEIILEREQYWIDKLNSKMNGYNISDASFGDTLTHHPNKENIIRRIKTTLRTKCDNMSEDEKKAKYGRIGEKNGMFGRHRTEEEKKHLSEMFSGQLAPWASYPRSEEYRKKISQTRIKEEVAKGEKNPFYGKKHSIETKKIISEKHKGIKPANRRKVMAENLSFESIADCAKYFNICSASVIFRIKSKHWNWHYEHDEKITAKMAV